MKLFRAGYGDVWYYTVAKDIAEAVTNVQKRYNMSYLPVVAEAIDDVDGYKIMAVEEKQEATPEKKEETFTCKKCNESFDNKGLFLAHSRKCGKE